jgi:metacaspase-1
MNKGISLHIGVNKIDPLHYLDTNLGTLDSCITDARAMAEIARQQGFNDPVPLFNEPNKVLTNNDAQAETVINAILGSLAKLDEGDTFFLTYAGHGGQVPDINRSEGDGYDETWCLHNRQLLDDELLELWTLAKPGVRIIIVSDSCHNGTVIGEGQPNIFDSPMINLLSFNRFILRESEIGISNINFEVVNEGLRKADLTFPKERTLPLPLLARVYVNSRTRYNDIQRDVMRRLSPRLTGAKRDVRDLIEASIISLSACQDWQKTADGVDEEDNGVFTKALIKVRNDGNFLNYLDFHELIWNELKLTQTPNYFRCGSPNSAFELELPFSV